MGMQLPKPPNVLPSLYARRVSGHHRRRRWSRAYLLAVCGNYRLPLVDLGTKRTHAAAGAPSSVAGIRHMRRVTEPPYCEINRV
jgi:hypothetical protein